jgi:O-antigen ligase
MGLTYRMWLPDVLLQRFDHAYVENDEGNVEAADTVAQRFTIWKAGWGIMQDHPYGSGLRTYARYSAQYGTAGTMHHPDKDAHNEYVRIAVELSVPSLLIFLWFLSSLAITTFHCYVTGKDLGLSHVGFTGFAALLGISIPCMVGTFFFQANISGHFWLILGLACRADCLVRAHASGGAQDVGAWAA